MNDDDAKGKGSRALRRKAEERLRARTAGPRVEAIDVVWEFAAFLLTAGVFLLVGVSIAPEALVRAAGAIGWGVGAVLIALWRPVLWRRNRPSDQPALCKPVLRAAAHPLELDRACA